MQVPKKRISYSLSRFSIAELTDPVFAARLLLACHLSSTAGGKASGSKRKRSIHVSGARQSLASAMHSVGIDEETSQQHAVGSDVGQEQHISSSPEGDRKIDIEKQIFCNRSLNMKNIVAVGFDMDYTLAQYMSETFESLTYKGTIEKLVSTMRYPEELRAWSFDCKYMIRGLVLDKKRGNILKMDRHKYVKVAYHGLREISKEDKIANYGNTLIRNSFDEPDYALIDTLFALPESYLFAQLVDLKDNNPEKVPHGADYSQMYRDVRAAVDMCHRDGTLKKMVTNDPRILWDFTKVVMNFLCCFQSPDGSSSCNYDWLDNFDVVITGSSKPRFFHEDNRASLFEVDTESGMLVNTDNGSPCPQIGDTAPRLPSKGLKKDCKVFQGGNVGHLHKLLQIESSSQVLYVGDHIYGDILQSKKVLGWRTMLVIPELANELKLLGNSRDSRKGLRLLRKERDVIENRIHNLQCSLSLKSTGIKAEDMLNVSPELRELESQREEKCLQHQQTQQQYHHRFHKVWGQLMKTGYQNSRFAHQVERFACLYTSQVANLLLYPPDKHYRPSDDFMPHEFDILTE
ncbi:5'-nucleotidase domain-containing protein 4-like isoform X2 [Macadamia integrifolia]|uniref:5'-nucleotidase domain-containing protein 4-like isoform X2 n=1 Tax=Macadamia integrifolia TaxID=60698 RepID=UPI001C4EC843|nr:5'-nucleotidase domain-containing protein 4-like isoform X2 [Macadamia integrifolia]